MENNHHDRNSHIYKHTEIKLYNLRPETHHVTVKVNNNNNNYAFVRQVANELISLSNALTSRDKRTNDSKDPRIRPQIRQDDPLNLRILLN